MKAKLNTWMNVLLTAILGLIGYSCGGMVEKYGVPMADLTLEGTVSHDKDEPLQNIQIIQRAGWKDGAGTQYWSEGSDTLYTNSDGKFYRYYPGHFPNMYFKIIANDTTGIYASDSIEASVTYSGGDREWYEGKGELKADFVLKKKENQ